LIIKKRTTCTKKKRIVLKGHFFISIQELLKKVKEAELNTKTQIKKKVKTKNKAVLYNIENKEDIEDEAQDEIESDIKNYIIVDIE